MSEGALRIDVSGLPSDAFGHRTLLWWGTIAFIVIESMTLITVAGSYLYVFEQQPAWPPPPTPVPPTVTLLPLPTDTPTPVATPTNTPLPVQAEENERLLIVAQFSNFTTDANFNVAGRIHEALS